MSEPQLLRTEMPQTAAKRQAIEDVAAELFATRGYEGVSMRDIASAAGIQLGSLTYLYREKLKIYDLVVVAAVENLAGAIIEATAHLSDPQAAMRAFIAIQVKIHTERTTYGQIIAREMIDGGRSRVAVLGRTVFRRLREVMNPVVIALSGDSLTETEASSLTGRLANMIFAGVRSADLYAIALGTPAPTQEELIAELEGLIMFGVVRQGANVPSIGTPAKAHER